MQQVHLDEAITHLAELVEAALRGEVVLITKDRHSSVRLVPIIHTDQPRRAGSARGMVTIADDFDAPLDDFTEYMQ